MFKHVLLSRILIHLARKPTPFRYVETHAGIGLYDLGGDEAKRGGDEWRDGIGRLTSDGVPQPARTLMAPYLETVGPRDPSGRPSLYPGSPILALALARAIDRLILCELHPAGAETLRRNIGRSRNAKVIAINGYVALNAYLPPPERRGLVLVDPPFEQRTEFADILAGLQSAHRKWPTGVYALWYPLKNVDAVARFTTGLMASGIRRIAQAELVVDRDALDRGDLGGCGMVIVNPPFLLEEEAGLILPALAELLGRLRPGSWHWRWLVDE